MLTVLNYCELLLLLNSTTQAALATACGFAVYNAVSRTITRLPALAFPLNAARIVAVLVPYAMCALNTAVMPDAPYWFTTEHSSFEQQHTAYTAEIVSKVCAIPLVSFYVMLSSSGVVLVPARMFYTAYTLSGATTENAWTKLI
jgi:hypothetical protein